MTHDTTDSTDDTDEALDAVSRRTLLAAGGVAIAGAAGHLSGRAAAQSAPSGTFPADSDDPLLRVRTERINLVERQSAPSEDGVLFWNGDP